MGLRNEAFIRERVESTGGNKKVGEGHGRSKSSVPTSTTTAGAKGLLPKTPERPTTAGGARLRAEGGEVDDGYEEEEEARKKKDGDVMSRLRRVKSLFNTKGGKLRRLGGSRPGSRPGTSHSSVGGE